MAVASDVVVRALVIATIVLVAMSQRTFVPNGRYGKRAEIPIVVGAQSGVGSGTEEIPSPIIFRDRLLVSPMCLCTQTRVGDYYRCTRRTGNNFDEPSQ